MTTQRLVDFVANSTYETLPAEVKARVKGFVKDTLAVQVASASDPAVAAARRMAFARSSLEEATALGAGRKLSVEWAAFVNSVLASTLDLDDGSMGLPGHPRFHRGHPGGIVIPAALAVAEREKSSGRDFVAAVAVGYEVALITSWAFGHSVLAGQSGTYGAAVASAKLMNLSVPETVQAVHIAESHCPTPTYAFIWKRTDMTKEAPAWGSMTGVCSALLARAGFRGAPTVFDLPERDMSPLEALGREWEILGVYTKRYSACRVCHAHVDGVLEIMAAEGLGPEDVALIEAGCSADKSLKMDNYRPTNVWQAQYSLPFAVGAALTEGRVGPDQVNPGRLNDPDILRNAGKVRMFHDSTVNDLIPGSFAGSIRLKTKDGRLFERFVRYPAGEPENPLPEEEMEEKYRHLTIGVLGAERSGRLEELIRDLERLEQVDGLTELLWSF